MTLCQRHGQSGVLRCDDGRSWARWPRGSRQGGRPRPRARPGQGDHERPRRSRRVPRTRRLSSSAALVTTRRRGRVAIVATGKRWPASVSRTDLLRALDEAAEPADEPEGRHRSRAARAASPGSGRRRHRGAERTRGRRLSRRRHRPGHPPRARRASTSTSPSRATPSPSPTRSRGRSAAVRRRTEKFGTAVVSYGDGERVDVVTTRTEFYDAPGALPAVERAGLREDLFRRDFTINAMAASLKARGLRPARGPVRRQGRSRRRESLRVLHNLSFIDDPTRIFRGIRYESAVRASASTSTRRGCCGVASRWGSSATSRPSRLRDELVALLEDRAAANGIRRLGELGADRAIHPHLGATTRPRGSSRARPSSRDELGCRRTRVAHRARGARRGTSPPTRRTTGSSG